MRATRKRNLLCGGSVGSDYGTDRCVYIMRKIHFGGLVVFCKKCMRTSGRVEQSVGICRNFRAGLSF